MQSNYALRFELCTLDKWRHVVALFVEALGSKPQGRVFDYRRSRCDFHELILPAVLWAWVDTDCNTTECQ